MRVGDRAAEWATRSEGRVVVNPVPVVRGVGKGVYPALRHLMDRRVSGS